MFLFSRFSDLTYTHIRRASEENGFFILLRQPDFFAEKELYRRPKPSDDTALNY